MQTDITLNTQANLLKTGDQVTVQAEGLTLLIRRQDEGISVYTYGSGAEALKEDWTLFTEAEPADSAYEAAARAAGWSQISAQDEHDEAFVLQVDGQDDRIEYYGDWEKLCVAEGIEVKPAALPSDSAAPAPVRASSWASRPDLAQAESEGWWIAECSGLETETARLERIDDAGIFTGDAAAWVHVWGQAQSGSAYHQSVLNWLKENAPVEFKRISDHQEALADKTTWAIVNDAGDFWSNDDGWVDQESKTLFYAHEKVTMNLPIGGKWALIG
ncbi:hypothetical protein [Microvirga sp. Mcv34]|uniref:hypothetical protein n=1 Tax=Microvirga sp. Mcv34 TaxID=2926016 RepID=UPI0021C86497|nr:hypothetical protein [Microvirga sp. Mcv34]